MEGGREGGREGPLSTGVLVNFHCTFFIICCCNCFLKLPSDTACMYSPPCVLCIKPVFFLPATCLFECAYAIK